MYLNHMLLNSQSEVPIHYQSESANKITYKSKQMYHHHV